MNTKKRIAFLFGSGISIKAGLPSTKKITEAVKKELRINKVWQVCDDWNFIIDDIKEFQYSKEVKETPKEYEPNYEDIYFTLNQMPAHLIGQTNNPLVGYYIKSRRNDLAKALNLSCTCSDYDLIRLIDECCENKIAQIVKNMTDIPIKNISVSYKILSDIIADNHLFDYDIFTLNHDLLLEQFLEEMNIAYCDGFGGHDSTYKIWDSILFDKTSASIRLFKLHGSINWYFAKHKIDKYETHLKPPLGKTKSDLESEAGGNYHIYDSSLLIGTFNKMLRYTGGIFRELYCRFDKHLRESTYLIVSGYGFGDQGINNVIIDWLNDNSCRKLIIINPDDIDLLIEDVRIPRPAMLSDIRQSTYFCCKFEDACWSEIKKLLI
jgi:hypothetical protein